MKKITTILLLFISTLSLSQEDKRILEAYILDNHSQQEVSSLKISKKDLLWMINNYLHEIPMTNSEKENFKLINNEFNLKDLKTSVDRFHNFSFKTGKRKFKKFRYSDPIFSKDKNYAIFCEIEKCKGGLCESGALILMEKINGKWKKKEVLFAFIS